MRIWWNEEMAELRRQCHPTRRQAQHIRNRETWEAKKQRHRVARGALKRAIRIASAGHGRSLATWSMKIRGVGHTRR